MNTGPSRDSHRGFRLIVALLLAATIGVVWWISGGPNASENPTGLASSSEIVHSSFSKVRVLLESVREIEVMNLNRPDECCGFGGTFAVAEEAVSCAMGRDRVADHQNSGVEVMTGVDMSCLMHMDGLIQRNGVPIRVLHISEILTAGQS